MIGPLSLRTGLGMGAGTRLLSHPGVIVRIVRPHRDEPVPEPPPGYRTLIAVADLPGGFEEQHVFVPLRQARQACNPRRTAYGRALAAGRVPDGWRIA
jgi:hypothetical protein